RRTGDRRSDVCTPDLQQRVTPALGDPRPARLPRLTAILKVDEPTRRRAAGHWVAGTEQIHDGPPVADVISTNAPERIALKIAPRSEERGVGAGRDTTC